MKTSPSIRALYRIIGNIIGKQVWDRIANDNNLHPDPVTRKNLARQVINTITAFRKELSGSRDFEQVAKLIESLNPDEKIATKQFAWILEAYLLLNQSSTASAELTHSESWKTDRETAGNLVNSLIEKNKLTKQEIIHFFEKDFSANLVLTAHPTAGIQPDYMQHINDMIAAIQRVVDKVNIDKMGSKAGNQINDKIKKYLTKDSYFVKDIQDDISMSISHMVRAKPYNEHPLTPSDESSNFLSNIDKAWNVIPAKLVALENELKYTLGIEDKNFEINPEFFRVHSWVARDVDGNPTVSEEEHIRALLQEQGFFLGKYKVEVENLWKRLSDDFIADPNLPAKTFFCDKKFEQMYRDICREISPQYPNVNNIYQAYRVVLRYRVLLPLEKILENLKQIENETGNVPLIDSPLVEKYFSGDKNRIISELIKNLNLIRRNKEGVNTKSIDLLIKKAQIFGEFGSYGHTRQGNKILNVLMRICTGFDENGISDTKTNFILDSQVLDRKNLPQAGFNEIKLKIQNEITDRKIQNKLIQTLNLLKISKYGGIKRQIISMNSCFEDMLNVLVLCKFIEAFHPGSDRSQPVTSLPSSRIEIVPLTEQIIDLRASYKCTIEALCNRAWREYLVANNGRFVKMRGPSDSGKQNGFVASQWEMFKSKQLDTVVIEIFNAFLKAHVFDDETDLRSWSTLYKNLDSKGQEYQAIHEALDTFGQIDLQSERSLWQLASSTLGLQKIKLVNFDGWGEPVERGGGLEFNKTVRCTQPIGSHAHYERTLQGGGAQQFGSEPRTKQAIQDYIYGLTEVGIKRITFDNKLSAATNVEGKANVIERGLLLDPKFCQMMNSWVEILRSSLRKEVFGIDVEDDFKVTDEQTLRNYFRHVVKSPLVYLDLFNIASRPTSRSGTKIKELLENPKFANSLGRLASGLSCEEIIQILNDVRAIPYAAMFNLLGGNHVSSYGFNSVLDPDLVKQITKFYRQKTDSQESELIRHIIDSLERGILTADLDCYRQARKIIESATNNDYNPNQDPLLNKLFSAQQAAIRFVIKIKGYKNHSKVSPFNLLQDDLENRDLMIARRNDAAIPRIGIAVAMSRILRFCKARDLNPLAIENIPINLLDLLRKAFAAGASTFGNGCID